MRERSLWPALHDARLEKVETSPETQRVSLRFHIPHFNAFGRLSADVRFEVVMAGLKSLTAMRFQRDPAVHWPAFGEEAERGYWESQEWTVFAPALRKKGFEVILSSLTEGEDTVTLTLEGLAEARTGPSMQVRLIVVAERIAVTRSDGAPFSLAALESLGAAYWEAWERSAAAARQA